MLADESDEVRSADDVEAHELTGDLPVERHLLGTAPPDRLDEPPALRELLRQRLRHDGVRGRDDDSLAARFVADCRGAEPSESERVLLSEALRAVAAAEGSK